ncbi:TonB-linked outer membrane protein, SusC/RagA family [Bacteroidales bacterium WCE2004]|nr:TonB-linked outer membrane protein, SusC/RagA family [Bacteroidales bacterium WCE2004]
MFKKLMNLSGVLMLLLTLCGGPQALAQTRTISGTVVDTGGLPVIGAAVMVVGNTQIGAATDINGAFTLNVPAGATLTIESIGYKSQTVAVGDKTTFDIVLEEDAEMLEETVVIGYGVQRKSDLSGAVASVKSADLADRSTSDAAAALQGKAAGVQIFNASGAPGEGSSIRVRGISSNSGSGLGPLLIVDGLQVDNINYLDPAMIESMEVLKDGASAAIYGAQAGNGVVLITTKSGAKSKDGSIFYNYKLSVDRLGHHAQVMNARQYIDWQHTAGLLGTAEELIANGTWDGVTDTNWADVLYGTGYTHNHTFGAQGGNDRGSYFLSVNYVDQDGMARGNKDVYKRLTAQINADYKIKTWFTVGTNTSIERYEKQMLGEHSEYAGSGAGLLGTLIIDPLTPVYFKSYDELSSGMQRAVDAGVQKVYRPAEHPDWWYSTSKILEGDGINPLIYRDRNENKEEGWNIRGTVFANLTPLKGLVITSRLGYRIAQSYSSNYEEPFYVNAKAYSTVYKISASSSQNYHYQWENFANFNRSFGKHDITAMAGMSYTYKDRRSVGASLEGENPLKGYAPNFRFLTQDNGSGTKSFNSGIGEPHQEAQISYFGRLGYTYDNRYNIQTNFRADAYDSSRLSPENRWGYFPSVSGFWNISNERFFKDNVDRNLISFLKLRGSWGINGNIAVLYNYLYSTSISYNSQSYQFGDTEELTLGSVPDGLANPDLTWETSVQTDLGLDLRMFNNRLTFGFDWFNKNTEDLLVPISPKAEVGISSTTVNAGSVNNRGFEFELGWQDTVGELHYSINANLSTLENKVTYLEPSVGHQSGTGFANYKLKTYFETGYPVWYLRGFKYAGIGENGKANFYDIEGNITQAPTDNDLQYIGNTLPTVTYGVTLRLDWKGLDFTLFGTGAGGNDLVPCVYRTQHMNVNSLTYFYEQAGKSIPTIDKIWDQTDFWSSSATVFKGDYFKIKQIQLGYSLPKKWLNKAFISSLRIYASMDDWFVFTNYPGFDPETASTGGTSGRGLDKGSYPNAKRMLFGINITF